MAVTENYSAAYVGIVIAVVALISATAVGGCMAAHNHDIESQANTNEKIISVYSVYPLQNSMCGCVVVDTNETPYYIGDYKDCAILKQWHTYAFEDRGASMCELGHARRVI